MSISEKCAGCGTICRFKSEDVLQNTAIMSEETDNKVTVSEDLFSELAKIYMDGVEERKFDGLLDIVDFAKTKPTLVGHFKKHALLGYKGAIITFEWTSSSVSCHLEFYDATDSKARTVRSACLHVFKIADPNQKRQVLFEMRYLAKINEQIPFTHHSRRWIWAL